MSKEPKQSYQAVGKLYIKKQRDLELEVVKKFLQLCHMYCSAVVMVLLAGFKFGECPRLEGKQPPSILGNQKN